MRCNHDALHLTATHCNELQHAATHICRCVWCVWHTIMNRLGEVGDRECLCLKALLPPVCLIAQSLLHVCWHLHIRVAACCSVLQCVAVHCSALRISCLTFAHLLLHVCWHLHICLAACCSVLQCVEGELSGHLPHHTAASAMRWHLYVLVAVCADTNTCVLQCVAVCCSVLQCVAVCCSAMTQSQE